ncbi:MAG: hypothetical protein ACRER2_16155 [Methylococcales bacterium]
MQAIQFETCLEKGMIRLPISYQHWQEGKQAKVIILVDDNTENQPKHEHPRSINRHSGKIALTEEPLEFQQNIRDEWA